MAWNRPSPLASRSFPQRTWNDRALRLDEVKGHFKVHAIDLNIDETSVRQTFPIELPRMIAMEEHQAVNHGYPGQGLMEHERAPFEDHQAPPGS